MKVSAILRKDRKDKDGLCKIVIRINNKDQKKYITTDYSVKPSQFKNGRVDKHPQAAKINAEIASIIQELHTQEPQSTSTFKEFADLFINQHENSGTRSEGVIRYYRSQLNKFLGFAGEKITLAQLTPELLQRYRSLMKKIGNAAAGMKSSEKFLKVIINEAILHDLITKNPYDKLETIKEKERIPTFLTADEVKKIEQFPFDTSSPLFRVGKWFLIQCYTAFRTGDLSKLKINQIKSENRITIVTGKTGSIVSREATPELIELIEQAGPFNISLEEYNRQLKSLAAAVGIHKNLTSHVGRHTLAMRWLEIGKKLETVQKVLGHADIKTTQIYAKVQNKTIDEEFKTFSY